MYIVGLLLAPTSALVVIAQPYLLKLAIDDAIIPGDIPLIRTMALYYLAAVVGAFVIEVVYSIAMSYAALNTIADLRRDVFGHTLSLKQGFFDKQPTGRLLTRATSDVEALGETLTAGAITIVLDALLVVGVLVAMFSLHARLTLVLLCMAPVIAVLLEVIRRILRRLYLEVRESLAELNAFIAERLTGVQIVQLYSDETRATRLMDERLGRYRSATIRTNVWDALLYATVDGIASVCVAVMLWQGAGQMVEGAISAGLLVAFIDYLNKLFRPIREFSQKVAILQRAGAALEKIFSILDNRQLVSAGDPAIAEAGGAIVLEDVHFAYSEDGPDVLRGVSLRLEPGEVLAVVGRTGSGKTTLGKLLTRSYDGYRGSITVGGVELSTIPPRVAREAVGMVRQDVQLFPQSVRYNLNLGRNFDDDKLWEAIRTVRADDAVTALGGLGATIAHQGANLSVGEGQLLAFARTMAQDPPIVILDEATASVDTLTEAKIQQATDALLEAKTVLVIAHRLSTITGADQIAVMEQGKIIEIGTHHEMLTRNGHYARLFRQQFEESAVD